MPTAREVALAPAASAPRVDDRLHEHRALDLEIVCLAHARVVAPHARNDAV
jgi:hypothetical protein